LIAASRNFLLGALAARLAVADTTAVFVKLFRPIRTEAPNVALLKKAQHAIHSIVVALIRIALS
jgi:hypothetical protein